MRLVERKFGYPPRLLLSLLTTIALLYSWEVPGVEQPVEPTQPPYRLELIDVPRDYLSEKFVNLVSGIDRFFGDDRNFEESNQSVFQLDLTRVSGYGGTDKFELSGKARVRLPATEGKLHLLLETDPENNVTAEPTHGQNNANEPPVTPVSQIATPDSKVATPKSYAAALRYEKKGDSRWYYSADAGIQFSGITADPNPFARTRGSYSIPWGQWRLKATESIFWFYNIGIGESTQFDMERYLSEPFLFRATSNATWLYDKLNFDLRQDFSLYHTLSERTAVLYQASVIGVSNPNVQATDMIALVTYRYRLHRDWVFVELSPQLHFPKIRNFRTSPTLSVRLEMLFDESK